MQTQISSPFSSLSYEKRWDATDSARVRIALPGRWLAYDSNV